MRFLLDENFPKAAVTVLTEKGHTCVDVRGTKLEGEEDQELVEEAQRVNAMILTTDRDFCHTLRHEYPHHAGITVIALRKPDRQTILERLEWILNNVREEYFAGRAFQLRDHTRVVQPPLPA